MIRILAKHALTEEQANLLVSVKTLVPNATVEHKTFHDDGRVVELRSQSDNDSFHIEFRETKTSFYAIAKYRRDNSNFQLGKTLFYPKEFFATLVEVVNAKTEFVHNLRHFEKYGKLYESE